MVNHEPRHLTEIVAEFQVSGRISEVKAHGSGHINNSFYLQNAQPDLPNYLLQRINGSIFKNIPGLMENISRVIDHLKSKLGKVSGSNPDLEVLTLVKTRDDKFYHIDAEGNSWRMYHYLKNTRSYDVIEDSRLGYEGGKAFGKFQAQLIDMDLHALHETIPNFHNLEKRVSDFNQAILNDAVKRKAHIAEEIEFLLSRVERMIELSRKLEAVNSKRITHNDTKFNNLLLNQDNKAQCVVDLDTVMPGYLAYDFGDAIRTLINIANEDEENLEKITLNIPLFTAYTKGYLDQASEFITRSEIDSLSSGMLILPYMQSVRFLTDHLNGDKYYKTLFSGHNLQRTRAQNELLAKLENNMPLLEKIIMESAAVALS